MKPSRENAEQRPLDFEQQRRADVIGMATEHTLAALYTALGTDVLDAEALQNAGLNVAPITAAQAPQAPESVADHQDEARIYNFPIIGSEVQQQPPMPAIEPEAEWLDRLAS